MSSTTKQPAKRFNPKLLRQDSLAAAFAAVAQILSKILQGRNLDNAMQSIDVPAMVRASVVDMTYNTLRAYGRGEMLLDLLLSRSLKQHEIQSLLLVALWRLEEKPTDRHTTVDQAVTAAGVLARGRFRNLVNGVLRNYLRREDELKEAISAHDEAQWHYPRWWIEKLRSAYPQEWESILIAGNSHPPLSLRVNKRITSVTAYSQILTDNGMAIAVEGAWGLRLLKPVGVDAIPGFHKGVISVQDLGAQHTAALLDLQTGQRVLDACAAPGGKTAHIMEWADVEMLALEAEPKRAQRIHENLDRLHLHAQVKVTDCRHVDQWWDGRSFDRILADVPCSASGVVRRHPDAKYLRRPEDVYSFAATQREIIDALWPVLAPGGKMLYCTCSVFPEENGQQIAAFLERHPDAERMMIAGQDELQLLPNADHDGFYFALLRKRAP
jgi:16S rRNA (cytosine967-C5)-methyltransferase